MSMYGSWNSDYYEHVARGERAGDDRESVRKSREVRAMYKPFYERMILQRMSWGWSDYFSSYAIDAESVYEYSGGNVYHRRLLSADINSSWEQIQVGDVPKDLVWVDVLSRGEAYESMLKRRMLSIILPRLEEMGDEVIAMAHHRKLRGKYVPKPSGGMEDALQNEFPSLKLYDALWPEIQAMRKWEASMAPNTPIYGRDALAILRK